MSLSVNARGNTGSSYDQGQLIDQWTDRIEIMGYNVANMLGGNRTAIGYNFARESVVSAPYLNNQNLFVPVVGEYHSIYPNCCCSAVRSVPMPASQGNSTDSVYIDVSWIQIVAIIDSSFDGGTFYANRHIQIQPFQQQEIRNFDAQHKRTKVKYARTSGPSNPVNLPPPNPTLAGLWPPYRIADLRVPRTCFSIKIIQYEDVKGETPGDDFNGFTDPNTHLPVYNNDDWLGFFPNTLLYLGRMVSYEGIPIARVEYNFLTNERGWNKFLAVYTQQNGYVPPDLNDLPDNVTDPATTVAALQNINGVGAFDMLNSVSFNDSLPFISQAEF